MNGEYESHDYFENEKGKDPADLMAKAISQADKARKEDKEYKRSERQERDDREERFEKNSLEREERSQKEIQRTRIAQIFGYSFSLCPQFGSPPPDHGREWEGEDREKWAVADAHLKALWIREFWSKLFQDKFSSDEFYDLLVGG